MVINIYVDSVKDKKRLKSMRNKLGEICEWSDEHNDTMCEDKNVKQPYIITMLTET